MRVALLLVAALAAALCACGDDSGSQPDAFVPTCDVVEGRPPLGLVQIATGFDMPVYVTSPPGDPRLFVLEKSGTIRIVDDGLVLPAPFLDVSVPGLGGLDDERGLLGLAFHPGYATNRKLYVFYTDANSDTVVEQYLASEADPNVADAASATEVFFLSDFAGNHNGGTIQFGPDGYLYIGIGDGGGANDPMDYGQDLDVAFGKILRIDVDELPYTIPSDNPFAGATAGLDEIWSYGWRNPWRWSFDRMTGDMYVGDVGQGDWEEWDVEPANSPGGVNYGWNDREGAHCFPPGTSGCATDQRVDPVYEVSQGEGVCSAIGGYVYRGCQMPGYHGTYFFADYCGGWVRSFEWDGADGYTAFTEWPDLGSGDDIVSLGEDSDGELYLVLQNTGQIMRIVPQ